MPVQVSIIICTLNHAPYLQQTLASLAQVCVPEALTAELIVVDNGSTDNTAEVIRQFRSEHLEVKYVSQPKRGQCEARNAGLSAAQGEVILFTDDDICFPADWITGMCGPILGGEADAVAGGVKIAPHLQRDWMDLSHRCWLAGTDWIEEPEAQSMVGANMAFSRRVLDKVPRFDTELGPGALGFYDETLFAWQIREAGFRIAARLEVAVEHHFEANRLQKWSFLSTAAKYGRSLAYVRYHWEHEDAALPWLSFVKKSLRLLLWRVRNHRATAVSGGIALPEFHLVKDISFFRYYWQQQGQTRRYARHGLEKLRRE